MLNTIRNTFGDVKTNITSLSVDQLDTDEVTIIVTITKNNMGH